MTEIYTSNYNVTFYDMDYNNVPYTTEYAVKLTNQLITGLSLTTSSTMLSMSMNSSLDVTSPSSTLIWNVITIIFILLEGGLNGGLLVITVGMFVYIIRSNVIVSSFY